MAGGAARRTERLMCLVFMLKAQGRRGITRSELRSAIEDYAQAPNEAAFERAFERDKSDLRDIGIDIVTVQRDAYHEDDFAYMLGEQTLLTLPAFTPSEMQLLHQAALAWQEGPWQALATDALHKLEVFGDAVLEGSPQRLSVHGDLHLSPIRAAIRDRRSLTFEYQRPGDSAAGTRHVEPWGLIHREGAWYLVGFDRDRGAARVFRTSRITSDPTPGEASASPVPGDWPTVLRAEALREPALPVTLLARPDRGWSWRNGAEVDGQEEVAGLTYDVLRLDLDIDDRTIGALAAAAPSVLVSAPATLRTSVMDALSRTEAAHG